MSDREWMEQTAKYFTVGEPEYLTCTTLKDAVMLHIDRETYQSRVQGKPLVFIATKDAEIARLTGCLERANAQAEHFEREWYLRGEVLDTAEYWLGSLLAVIHRDGGHYEAEHGTARAADDAIAAVHVLRGSLEGYVEANRYMKGELDDALEDARKCAEAQREIARLRHEVAMLCGYDSADEMDAATGRRK